MLNTSAFALLVFTFFIAWPSRHSKELRDWLKMGQASKTDQSWAVIMITKPLQVLGQVLPSLNNVCSSSAICRQNFKAFCVLDLSPAPNSDNFRNKTEDWFAWVMWLMVKRIRGGHTFSLRHGPFAAIFPRVWEDFRTFQDLFRYFSGFSEPKYLILSVGSLA